MLKLIIKFTVTTTSIHRNIKNIKVLKVQTIVQESRKFQHSAKFINGHCSAVTNRTQQTSKTSKQIFEQRIEFTAIELTEHDKSDTSTATLMRTLHRFTTAFTYRHTTLTFIRNAISQHTQGDDTTCIEK